MATKQLNFVGLPSLAIAEDAVTPDPGIPGVQVWSSTLSKIVTWNGSAWKSDQAVLVSSVNIKTINGVSVLGAGNIVVSGGGGGHSPIISWLI